MAEKRERIVAVLDEHGFDSMQHPELVDDLTTVCGWAEAENTRLREKVDRYEKELRWIAAGPKVCLDPGYIDAARRALGEGD